MMKNIKLVKQLPRCVINKSKLLLIQDVWSCGTSSSCIGKGNITPKFQWKNPVVIIFGNNLSWLFHIIGISLNCSASSTGSLLLVF
jgi:hypothetical protein